MRFGKYLLSFLVVMALLIAFGENGLVDNYILSEKLAIIREANRLAARESQQFKREIQLLRGDALYIESIARNELGMVKKGDIVYRFAE